VFRFTQHQPKNNNIAQKLPYLVDEWCIGRLHASQFGRMGNFLFAEKRIKRFDESRFQGREMK